MDDIEFVEAGGDATEVFEPVEEPFDQISGVERGAIKWTAPEAGSVSAARRASNRTSPYSAGPTEVRRQTRL